MTTDRDRLAALITEHDRAASACLKMAKDANDTAALHLRLRDAARTQLAALPPEPPAISVALYDRLAGIGPLWYGAVDANTLGTRKQLHTALTAEGWMERPVLTEEEANQVFMVEHNPQHPSIQTVGRKWMLATIRRLTGRPAGATTTTEEGT